MIRWHIVIGLACLVITSALRTQVSPQEHAKHHPGAQPAATGATGTSPAQPTTPGAGGMTGDFTGFSGAGLLGPPQAAAVAAAAR